MNKQNRKDEVMESYNRMKRMQKFKSALIAQVNKSPFILDPCAIQAMIGLHLYDRSDMTKKNEIAFAIEILLNKSASVWDAVFRLFPDCASEVAIISDLINQHIQRRPIAIPPPWFMCRMDNDGTLVQEDEDHICHYWGVPLQFYYGQHYESPAAGNMSCGYYLTAAVLDRHNMFHIVFLLLERYVALCLSNEQGTKNAIAISVEAFEVLSLVPVQHEITWYELLYRSPELDESENKASDLFCEIMSRVFDIFLKYLALKSGIIDKNELDRVVNTIKALC